MENTKTSRPAYQGSSGLARLTSMDRIYLHDENAAWPCHFGGLAVLDGMALRDASGQLRLGEIRDQLNRRLARVPDLRQRVYFPAPSRDGPLWVDDDRFAIEHHLHETVVESPGGEAQLLEAAARLYAGLLDRTRPLWELWFLTGLGDGRVGVLLKLHHSVADGTAAASVMGSLFNPEPDAPDPVSPPWTPGPSAVVTATFGSIAHTVARVGRGSRP
jgi:diacylglycerol O-acyltransferase / wax synthase